jgi:hypothetical protein
VAVCVNEKYPGIQITSFHSDYLDPDLNRLCSSEFSKLCAPEQANLKLGQINLFLKTLLGKSSVTEETKPHTHFALAVSHFLTPSKFKYVMHVFVITVT